MGRSARPSTNLNRFYPVAGAAGIRNAECGYTQNLYHVKTESKISLVKVLEILKNFFQEVFKWGLGQSPKVFLPHRKEYTHENLTKKSWTNYYGFRSFDINRHFLNWK